MKPGWQTSEFWIALASQVIAFLTVIGVIRPDQSASIGQELNLAITSIFALVGAALTAWKYIHARQVVKTASARP